MCGIAGIISLSGQPIKTDIILHMLTKIAHRGPNGKGIFSDDGSRLLWTDIHGKVHHLEHPWPVKGERPVVVLGHRRLAIIDLTEAGHQPMTDEEMRYWITYNGEVYNYIEIREELTAKGHSFRTQTDTEVILAAFREWGESCLNRFNGMWGFAIWDAKERNLCISRDRFGVKPLYICKTKGALCFASEAKALVAISERRPNFGVLGAYLLYGTVDHHPTQTFFNDIHRLASGHILKTSGDSIFSKPFWDPSVPDCSLRPTNFEEACTKFMETFHDSIRLRLRSDVPVGSCLSGGLDSSAIVCAIAKLRQEQYGDGFQQHTVTARFGNTTADEWPYAQVAAEHTGSIIHFADASSDDLMNCLHKLIWHQDEPFYGLSMYAQWCVFREAKRNGLTVMLDGQGADELLGGYEPWDRYFKDLAFSFNWKYLMNEARMCSARTGESLTRLFARSIFPSNGRLRKLYNKVKNHKMESNKLFSSELNIAGRQFQREISANTPDLWNLLFKQWTITSLPALLRFEDRNSMAHSIEARLPFLDYRLMRLGFSLVDEHKLRNGWTKAVLREGTKGLLPEKIRLRKIKMGFQTPQKCWMVNFGERLSEEILCNYVTEKRGWFNMPVLKKAVKNINFHRSHIGWLSLNAEIWARRLLDEQVPQSIFK